MKFCCHLAVLLVCHMLQAQELHQTDYEKGYIKNGIKYSVWQYFNSSKEVELVINHSTGRIMYVIPDTSYYVIYKNETWIVSKLDVHPIPIVGYQNFYLKLLDTLTYPAKDYKNGLEGKVVATFDVDTLGVASNYNIIKSIGGSCDSTVLSAFKSNNVKWVPAVAGKKKYQARFALGFEFRLKPNEAPLEHEDFKVDIKEAKLLEEFMISESSKRFLPKRTEVFTFVEQSAEPVGGIAIFYKWVQGNLRYPDHARRMGLEGKVFVKFVIEPTGAITNAEIVKGGFDPDCNKEALRIISSSRWVPGRQNGRAVRQAYILPIPFKLNE